MAKGVVVCYWGPGHKTSGHLGLAVEADAGKTYITWVPEGTSGEPGLTQALQDDFRVQTGIRDDARNEALALGMGPLRTGQVRTNRLSNTLTKTPTQVAVGTQSYTFNYGQIFRKPDLECEIPAIDATGGTQLGLDVERIYHWWMGFEAATKGVNAQAKAKVAGARAIPWKKVSAGRHITAPSGASRSISRLPRCSPTPRGSVTRSPNSIAPTGRLPDRWWNSEPSSRG
jgi:hypothetical protein